MSDARIRGLLERLGRRWPDGGLAGNSGIVESLQPYLDRLREADRRVIRASLDARFADSRVTILSRSVSRHNQRRDDLVQQVLHTRFQAACQRSSSGEANLRRIASEWSRELTNFDGKFGDRPRELTAARRDSQTTQTRLSLLRKQVSDLEEAVGRFFPLVVPERDEENGTGPYDAQSAPAPSGAATNGHMSLPLRDELVARPDEQAPVAQVRAVYATRGKRGRKVISRRVWRITRPSRAFRGRIVQALRR